MHQQLRHRPDPHAAQLARGATVVLALCFAAWLAWFGVTAPWDLPGGTRDAGEVAGRFFGIVLLLAAIVAPLAVAAIAGRRRP